MHPLNANIVYITYTLGTTNQKFKIHQNNIKTNNGYFS